MSTIDLTLGYLFIYFTRERNCIDMEAFPSILDTAGSWPERSLHFLYLSHGSSKHLPHQKQFLSSAPSHGKKTLSREYITFKTNTIVI